MKILSFPGIRLVIALVSGILSGFYNLLQWHTVTLLSCGTVFVVLLLHFIKTSLIIPHVSSIGIYIAVFFTGWLSVTFHTEKNHLHHYTKYAKTNTENTIIFQIRKLLKPGRFHDRYEVELSFINYKSTSGKAIVNISRDSFSHPIKVDDRYAAIAQCKKTKPALNPHQFDYKNYLEKQQLYLQFFTVPKTLYKRPSGKFHSLHGWAAACRMHINEALQNHGFKDEELAIINALLLGQRQHISKALYTSYKNAGAIHILALSGLHIGILLLVFNFLLSPLAYIKHGKPITFLLIIIMLWMFAIIAGLSASIVRAVTMFSFMAWAIVLKRTTNSYNILAVSIFFLLLAHPLFLFDVGFQLSYIAVFAIVWIQPLLYNWWIPAFKPLRFFWKILTVTLAAQCGVLPLSLYYFHLFPGLFFVSNLIIIPALGFILVFGILIIILALLNTLPSFLAILYTFLIKGMNIVIQNIATQKAFIVEHITFNENVLLIIYLILIFGVLVLKKMSFQRIACFLAAILLLQSILIYDHYQVEHSSAFIIFHKSRTTIIARQKGSSIKLYSHDNEVITEKLITDYLVASQYATVEEEPLKNGYRIGETSLLIIDSLGIYNVASLKPDYVLLCSSPKINLERMIATLQPKTIIADGSNYKSDIQRWKATCKALNIYFHATSENGAFIINDYDEYVH